jgi:hypothetical protein
VQFLSEFAREVAFTILVLGGCFGLMLAILVLLDGEEEIE